MKLTVNGIDFLPFVAENGIKITDSALDGENAGRTMDGTMIRDRVTTKRRIDVTCRDLETWESQKVLMALDPEFFEVTYTDPKLGDVTKTMYTNNIPATLKESGLGYDLWSGIAFPLIEQ